MMALSWTVEPAHKYKKRGHDKLQAPFHSYSLPLSSPLSTCKQRVHVEVGHGAALQVRRKLLRPLKGAQHPVLLGRPDAEHQSPARPPSILQQTEER